MPEENILQIRSYERSVKDSECRNIRCKEIFLDRPNIRYPTTLTPYQTVFQ